MFVSPYPLHLVDRAVRPIHVINRQNLPFYTSKHIDIKVSKGGALTEQSFQLCSLLLYFSLLLFFFPQLFFLVELVFVVELRQATLQAGSSLLTISFGVNKVADAVLKETVFYVAGELTARDTCG